MGCCTTAFFLCRRPAVERYLVFIADGRQYDTDFCIYQASVSIRYALRVDFNKSFFGYYNMPLFYSVENTTQ